MAPYCSQCGAPIPEGQSICSMCMGDPYHGSDGYYMAELERDYKKMLEEKEYEKMQEESEE